MDGTASVVSVVSLDESEPHFYKISPDEMNKLKHSLTLMEDRMRSLSILMGRAHIDPLLNELSTVNVTLAKAEKVPEDLQEMEDETLEELCSIIQEAADRDSEFIQEFKANAQELMIDFCIKKFQQSLFEEITEMFKQI
ncbi:hypothetical protein D6D08_07703 [Aureobasidium pullulans]|nr:hypothetical protein D6D08_07703 [Aureobasidium pullulans]